MAKEAKFTLGGRNYTVPALPIAQSRVWRDQIAVPFAELADVLLKANSTEINAFGDLSELIKQVSNILLGSVDLLLDFLFSYSPDLQKDRDWIEANAYDEEALYALAEVLKLAFPFGVLLEVVTGRTANKTLLNSPSPNGTLSLPASGPVRKNPKGK